MNTTIEDLAAATSGLSMAEPSTALIKHPKPAVQGQDPKSEAGSAAPLDDIEMLMGSMALSYPASAGTTTQVTITTSAAQSNAIFERSSPMWTAKQARILPFETSNPNPRGQLTSIAPEEKRRRGAFQRQGEQHVLQKVGKRQSQKRELLRRQARSGDVPAMFREVLIQRYGSLAGKPGDVFRIVEKFQEREDSASPDDVAGTAWDFSGI